MTRCCWHLGGQFSGTVGARGEEGTGLEQDRRPEAFLLRWQFIPQDAPGMVWEWGWVEVGGLQEPAPPGQTGEGTGAKRLAQGETVTPEGSGHGREAAGYAPCCRADGHQDKGLHTSRGEGPRATNLTRSTVGVLGSPGAF